MVQAGRIELIGSELRLSDEEAAAFWPIYKKYEAEAKVLGDERLAIITDYADNFEALTDEMEAKGEDYLRRIDEMGGVVRGIENGFFQREIANAAFRYQKEIEEKQRIRAVCSSNLSHMGQFCQQRARIFLGKINHHPQCIRIYSFKINHIPCIFCDCIITFIHHLIPTITHHIFYLPPCWNSAPSMWAIIKPKNIN